MRRVEIFQQLVTHGWVLHDHHTACHEPQYCRYHDYDFNVLGYRFSVQVARCKIYIAPRDVVGNVSELLGVAIVHKNTLNWKLQEGGRRWKRDITPAFTSLPGVHEYYCLRDVAKVTVRERCGYCNKHIDFSQRWTLLRDGRTYICGDKCLIRLLRRLNFAQQRERERQRKELEWIRQGRKLLREARKLLRTGKPLEVSRSQHPG